MTERIISYLLLLAATVTVFIVVIIQPHNTAVQKEKLLQAHNPNLADACMANYGMTCEEYAAMMTCTSQPGYTWANGLCTPPITICNNGSCTEAICLAMHYEWNGTSCVAPSSGSVPILDGVGTNEQVSQRIESKCLAHLENSGYRKTLLEYGWFDNVRIYAKNACTLAYLATNGKYSSNNDIYSIASLITNDVAVRAEDIGMLYKALENTPERKKDQSLNDYLDITKDGAAKYLKAVMDIMFYFNNLTTDQKINPTYLTEPLPYVTGKTAVQYNTAHGTKIISLEEKLFALLPQPEPEKIAEKPKDSTTEKITETPAEPTEIVMQFAEPKDTHPKQTQAMQLLTRVKNLFKEIRDAVIKREALSVKTDSLQYAIKTQNIINAFANCLKNKSYCRAR